MSITQIDAEPGIFSDFRVGIQKHRTSLRESSDVLHQKYGGLCPRSPMFLQKKSAFPVCFAAFLTCFAAKTVAKCRTLHEYESVIW